MPDLSVGQSQTSGEVTDLRRAIRDLVELAEGYHDYILKVTGSVDGFVVIERAKDALDG